MFTEVGQDDAGRRYYVAPYRTGCLAALPWGEEPFDCAVFLCDPCRAQTLRADLSAELARSKTDWVQVAGNGAEALHDAIDRASVALGRQRAIADGSPMTSWHTEAQCVEEMAEVASLCFGGHKRVLVLVVGQRLGYHTSIRAIRQRLTKRYGDSATLEQ